LKPLNTLSVTELDKRLWQVFSLYIRLRDTNEQGYGQCITSGEWRHWQSAHAGHGIGRQHFCTKYDERNVALQSAKDNSWGAGEQAKYAIRVDEIHGPGTWAELERKSKGSCKKTKFYFLEKIPEY